MRLARQTNQQFRNQHHNKKVYDKSRKQPHNSKRTTGWAAYGKLKNIHKFENKIYNECILSVTIYVSKIWVLKKTLDRLKDERTFTRQNKESILPKLQLRWSHSEVSRYPERSDDNVEIVGREGALTDHSNNGLMTRMF